MAIASKGVFPRNGVPEGQAAPGGRAGLQTTNCAAGFFYPAQCNPQIDVQSLNTIISELVGLVNCRGLSYDCNRQDNLCRAFNDLPDAQTQVRRPSNANPDNQATAAWNTYTADHFGTFSNVTWRVPWMERQGDMITVHMWNPDRERWDSFSMESAEELVVLNNPRIYVRPQSGQLNPPIEKQSDLTVANAFISMAAVRSFMSRALVVGRVTLDVAGTFSGPAGWGNLGPSQLKNAQQITIECTSGGENGAVVIFGGNDTSEAQVAFQASGGNITLRGINFRAVDQSTGDYVAAMNLASDATVTFAGTNYFSGDYNSDRPSAGRGFLIRNVNGGEVVFSDDSITQMRFDAGAVFDTAISVGPRSRLFIAGNVRFNRIGGNTLFKLGFVDLNAQGVLDLRTNSGAPAPLISTGSASHIAPYSVDVAPLAAVTGSGTYGGRAALIAYDWGVDVSSGGAPSPMRVNAIGVVNNVAGP